jgi:hypothetical protein
VIEMEKREWKSFRNALDKNERKSFDEMWDIPRLYVSACSNSCQLVPFQPIAMSILFHHYKELLECETEINNLMGNYSNNIGRISEVKEEDSQFDREVQDDFQTEQLTLFEF